MLVDDSRYKYKNIFFINEGDYFFSLQADSLINKAGISPESILAVVLKGGRDKSRLERLEGVEYVSFDDVELELLLAAKSFTFISLNNWNAPIAEKIISFGEDLLKKLYIFITDDEVERWRINSQGNGCLSVDIDAHISKSVIKVLRKVKYFIAPVPYFKSKISKSLNRVDVEVFDCSIVFDVLRCRDSYFLERSLTPILKNKRPDEIRVLVGTKSCEVKFFLNLIRTLNENEGNVGLSFHLLVFQGLKNRIIIDAFLLFRKFLKLRPIKITYFSKMPPHAYASIVASCNLILLQDRGGASTARLFCKWGRGTLVIKERSPNYFFFKDVYKIDFISFSALNEVPKLVNSSSIDVEKNRSRIVQEEKRSIAVFKEIYS